MGACTVPMLAQGVSMKPYAQAAGAGGCLAELERLMRHGGQPARTPLIPIRHWTEASPHDSMDQTLAEKSNAQKRKAPLAMPSGGASCLRLLPRDCA